MLRQWKSLREAPARRDEKMNGVVLYLSAALDNVKWWFSNHVLLKIQSWFRNGWRAVWGLFQNSEKCSEQRYKRSGVIDQFPLANSYLFF